MKGEKQVFGTYEWAVSNANFINGCFHNCKYCYSKEMAIRFKRKTASNWELEEELRNELENLKARIVTLEEDLQVEREKYQEEQSQRLILSSQSEALQSTIHEMEDKLLQVSYRFVKK